jgi:DNA-binding CsgD family transcriptional regulator/predicted negative regulator of RcsB-dependent stress response
MPSGRKRISDNTLGAAEAALDEARLSEAEELLRQTPGRQNAPERLLLQARLHHLQDHAPAVIGALSGQKFKDPQQEARRVLMLAIAHTRLNEYAVADEYFESALGYAERSHDAEFQSEIAYRRGRRYAAQKDLGAAREQLAIARQGTSPTRKVDALMLESYIYNMEGRHAQQADALRRALEIIDPADARWALSAAWTTHTLATLIREMNLPDAIPVVERHLRECTWPQDLNLQRFQSLKALGWSHALRGDYFNAFRYLKQSGTFAPNDAWRTIALLDRAYLARCVNESRWSRQELDEADEVAQRVDWHATRNEERVGLLLLAEMFAPIDSGKAARYMALYRELGELNAPFLLYSQDERLHALADYSAGVTQLALGNTNAGVKLLRQSLAAYEHAGYDWRAGRSAIRLYEATGAPEYLDLATEKLRHYPNSWLAEELRKHSRSQSAPSLPPMQQRVFEQLCRGLTTAEIAKNLGRSEFTIKNHIKLIFKAHGVNSRAALLAKLSSSSLS